MLQAGIQAAQVGDQDEARRLLAQVTALQPDNAEAWMWLAHAAPTAVEKRAALGRALALRPGDDRLRQAFRALLSTRHVQQAARSGVYISYTRADDVFAITLMDSLRAAGLDVWLDVTDIGDDTGWHSAISKALRRAGLMLALLSPAALESSDMQAERDWFHAAGKIVVPVLCRDCAFRPGDYYFRPVDFRADYQQGLRQLCALLGAAAPSAL